MLGKCQTRISVRKETWKRKNGHLFVLVPKRNGTVSVKTVHKENGTRLLKRCLAEFEESGCLIFRATSPLSRGQLKSNGHGKLSIHFAADLETITTVFRTITSVNQLSLYGAIAEKCEEYESLRERTERPVVMRQPSSIVMTLLKKIFYCKDTENELRSCHNKTDWAHFFGCRIPECCWDRRVFHDVRHSRYFTILCNGLLGNTLFQVDSGSSQPRGWIQGNTKIGPVLEVATRFFAQYGLRSEFGLYARTILTLVSEIFMDRIGLWWIWTKWNINSRSSARIICVKTGCERFCMLIEGQRKKQRIELVGSSPRIVPYWKEDLDRCRTRDILSPMMKNRRK